MHSFLSPSPSPSCEPWNVPKPLHASKASTRSQALAPVKPLGIYIHWPFCQWKCPYCDFNSHVRLQVDEEAWRSALIKELHGYKNYASSHNVHSIFFGGGTPSLMTPETVEALIETTHKIFPMASLPEITLEANPSSVETQKLRDFKHAGINRISLGVQALDAEALVFLGRRHSLKEAQEALNSTASLYSNFTFDLIYARPHQTVASWEQELKQALDFGSPHVSLYQLTIEPRTAFATRYGRGEFSLPSEEESAVLYERTQMLTEQKGLLGYEISNYARPDFQCRHNLVYWTYQDYIGIGPGAHGRLSGTDQTGTNQKQALKNYALPETWLQKVQVQGHGVETCIALSPQEEREESLLMGLRLWKGLSREHLETVWGKEITSSLFHSSTVHWLQDMGYLCSSPGLLKPTLKGMLCLNRVVEELSGVLSPFPLCAITPHDSDAC